MKRCKVIFCIAITVLCVISYAENKQSDSTSAMKKDSLTIDSLTTKPKQSTGKPASQSVITQQDDVLITNENEESIFLQKPVKPVETKGKSTSSYPSSESLKKQSTLSEQKDSTSLESSVQVQNQEAIQDTLMNQPVAPAIKKPQDLTIEETRSINFDKNLKEYKSPHKAMFLSLFIPGLGQLYTQSNMKTILFAALDIACIAGTVKFAMDGKKKREKAEAFADAHFKLKEKFVPFYRDLKTLVWNKASIVDTNIKTNGGKDTLVKKEIVDEIYAQQDVSYYEQLTNKKDIYDLANYTKSFEMYVNNYVQGWDDCVPGFSASNGYIISDTNLYKIYDPKKFWYLNVYEPGNPNPKYEQVMGYSNNQMYYHELLLKSSNLYTTSQYFIFVIVANHIASAIDAFISARAFNAEQLRKESVWNHINIDQSLSFSGNGYSSQISLKVRF